MAQQIIRSIAPDGKEVLSNILGEYIGDNLTFKETNLFADGTPLTDEIVSQDGVMYIKKYGKYFKQAKGEYRLEDYGFSVDNTAEENASIFNHVQDIIPENSLVKCAMGKYRVDDVEISKSGTYIFEGVTFVNNLEIAGHSINILTEVGPVNIIGIELKYEGIFYTSNTGYTQSPFGVSKNGIYTDNNVTILTNCSATGFSSNGFRGSKLSKAFYLINCISSYNGYSGAFSEGSDFQVIGGRYIQNGGSQESLSGYGIVCNVYGGNAKIMGVTATHNSTNNIDSHVGSDIIITNNYTDFPRPILPQWFNRIPTAGGYNIACSQRQRGLIIKGNVCKRGIHGISVHAGDPGDYLRSIIIDGNYLEDNVRQIRIRQMGIDSLSISNNTTRNNNNEDFPVEHDLNIQHFEVRGSESSMETISINGNYFSSGTIMTLSNDESTIPCDMSFNANTIFGRVDLLCGNVAVTATFSNNNLYRVVLSGGKSISYANFNSNIFDNRGEDFENVISEISWTGNLLLDNNTFTNSGSDIQIKLHNNVIFRNNKLIVTKEIPTENNTHLIRFVGVNTIVEGNSIVFQGVNEYNKTLWFVASDTTIVRNNHFNKGYRMTAGTNNYYYEAKVLFDPQSKEYNFGQTTPPDIVGYLFKEGDIVRNSLPSSDRAIGWIYFNSVWNIYGKLNKNNLELTTNNIHSTITHKNSYLYLNGGDRYWVKPSIFKAGDEIEGEVISGSRDITGEGDMILRSPIGQGLTIAEGCKFIIKFKTPTDALVTIIKPYEILNQGVVNQITTADATDEATAITLANANKAKINEIITKLSTIIFK